MSATRNTPHCHDHKCRQKPGSTSGHVCSKCGKTTVRPCTRHGGMGMRLCVLAPQTHTDFQACKVFSRHHREKLSTSRHVELQQPAIDSGVGQWWCPCRGQAILRPNEQRDSDRHVCTRCHSSLSGRCCQGGLTTMTMSSLTTRWRLSRSSLFVLVISSLRLCRRSLSSATGVTRLSR
jgi:hypothetical protein